MADFSKPNLFQGPCGIERGAIVWGVGDDVTRPRGPANLLARGVMLDGRPLPRTAGRRTG